MQYINTKEWLIVLGIIQLGVSYPLDGTDWMPLFGSLSILWVVIGTSDMWTKR